MNIIAISLSLELSDIFCFPTSNCLEIQISILIYPIFFKKWKLFVFVIISHVRNNYILNTHKSNDDIFNLV